jgi:hypothetical protein
LPGIDLPKEQMFTNASKRAQSTSSLTSADDHMQPFGKPKTMANSCLSTKVGFGRYLLVYGERAFPDRVKAAKAKEP